MKHTLLALAAAALFPLAVQAADTANMNVTANVVGTCKFTEAPDAAFGTLDPASGADVTASSAVKFWCTNKANYSLAVGNGQNFDGTAGLRRMKGPGASDFIKYSLTPESASGEGSGPQTPITVTLTGTVLGADYANAAVGAYADVVQLTITP